MSTTSYVTDALTLGTGLLLARLILGSLMVAHGGQKLFGWLGGYGIAGTAGFFEQLGFRPGRLFVITASLAELAGGTLLALGLLGPLGPALILSVMIVAAVSVHWNSLPSSASSPSGHSTDTSAGSTPASSESCPTRSSSICPLSISSPPHPATSNPAATIAMTAVGIRAPFIVPPVVDTTAATP